MPGPLQDVKVWDASWVGVGPLATRYLADYGATVVHTESPRSLDVLRNAPPFKDGVMERLGFGYGRLRELNPSVIMLSTSMNGQTGPRRGFAGFGTVLAAMSGFSELTGWPDRAPGSPYGAYTDFIGQRFAATAVLAALEHRDRTGQGQYIDLSQLETGLMFLAPELVGHQLTGRIATRDGNRGPHAAPHGVFPCRPEGGREKWVAVAVTDDDQWAAFRAALGDPAWAADPRLTTLAGRKEQEDRIEAAIAAWTRTRTTAEVVRALQPRVPAGPVHDAWGLQADPQVAHRRYFRRRTHTVMGEMLYEGAQVEMSLTPPHVSKAAPLLGEDNEQVLTELLRFSPAEVRELVGSGAVEQVLD
ncbi:CaiB/BaiF CoA transferase family protein [Nonomuraea aridisoli]|uniref:CoA transferase n=1 Tax=Nonomuraea aridisoli TaxID=2070368 RepID=A0A2W2E7W8_9ACTN|nr:CoA transferase [Nonomuraea aridisoli]PZG09650.1 hypothetical protein C1J01_37310 [Nonomuraea aridisoli]